MTIGSGRHVRAGVLFFDICGFSQRTSRDDLVALGETLYMLDCVIPMVMNIVFDYGGYVEKNTGDGVMAIMGVGQTPEEACTDSINVATVSLYALKHIINPHLESKGIDAVSASFGIDYGQLLLARIGTRRGAAKDVRSHVTAVGPTANIAFLLQEQAGGNEILVGDLVFEHAEKQANFFHDVTPTEWPWTIGPDSKSYFAWEYTGRKQEP